MIFLCWFGAAGYLLTRHGTFIAAVVLLSGRRLRPCRRSNRVSVSHARPAAARARTHCGRDRGCGRGGHVNLRRFAPAAPVKWCTSSWARGASAPARSEDGDQIAKQEEVFVVRYEKRNRLCAAVGRRCMGDVNKIGYRNTEQQAGSAEAGPCSTNLPVPVERSRDSNDNTPC